MIALAPLADAAPRLLARPVWVVVPFLGAHGAGLVFVEMDTDGDGDVHGGGGGGGTDATALPIDGETTPFLAAFLLEPQRVFVAEDAKPLLRWLLKRGLDIARPACLSTLDTLAGQRVDDGPLRLADVDGAVQIARRLVGRFRERLLALHEPGSQRAVARLECLVTRAFAALEHRGLPIDVDTWRRLVEGERLAAQTARAKILELAGDLIPRDLFGHAEINLEAEQEVRRLLERATGSPLETTSRHLLASLKHPLADAILAYREPWKIVSTYGDTFLDFVEDIPHDVDEDGRRIGRLRSTFVPLGASTGRVACREPNLQNLPKDARFHEALRAPRGRVLVTADYGTCELRIVAELAEDPVFLAAFDRGDDLHSTVATTMFGKPVSKTINPELRQRAKAINFGLVYGMGPGALASSLGVDRAAGEALLAQYFKTFPRIRDYLDSSVEIALKRGYSSTILGRTLQYDKEVLAADNARGELSRIMKNMPIQGTSADMTKLAMVRLQERLGSLGSAGLVNTVHDELVVECPAEDGDRIAEVVRSEMSEAHRTLLKRVPPEVEVHVGPVWAH